MLYPDQEIKDKKDDVLSRAPIAEKLAEAIEAYNKDESFVIGVQGAWGEGKTSFINLVLSSFDQKDDIVVVKFNPWYFTGEDQILTQFCSLLADTIETSSSKNEQAISLAGKIRKIAKSVKPFKSILNYGSFLAFGIPGLGDAIDLTADKVAQFTEEFEDAYKADTLNIVDLKKEIEQDLKTYDKKIIIVIDDIDRLSDKEVYEIFRLVKIIADFSKTFYILSYDKKNVVQSLMQYGYQENFLDKIVQQEFSIPSTSKNILNDQLKKELQDIQSNAGILKTDNDKEYYKAFDYAGIVNAFSNFRDLKRVLNTIYFEYALIKKEVNFVDFSILMVLKINAPLIYEHIKNYGHLYLNTSPTKDTKVHKAYNEFKTQLLESKHNESWAIPIMEEMFPVICGGDFNTSYGNDYLIKWIEMKRICVDQYFKRYFALSIPKDEISEDVYDKIYLSTSSREDFLKIICSYKDSDKDEMLAKILRRLRERVSKIPPENRSMVIGALLDLGDNIKDVTRTFYGLSAYDEAFYLALNLLNTFANEEKLSKFKKGITESKTSITTVLRFLEYIGKENDCLPNQEKKEHGKKSTFLDEENYILHMEAILERINAVDLNKLIDSTGVAGLWFVLDRYSEDIASKLRNDILELEDGYLKAAKVFSGGVVSSEKGFYWSFKFDNFRAFLGTRDNNDVLEKVLREKISSCKNRPLADFVENALNNALEDF